METGVVAAKLVAKELAGNDVDWEQDFSNYILKGVDVFFHCCVIEQKKYINEKNEEQTIYCNYDVNYAFTGKFNSCVYCLLPPSTTRNRGPNIQQNHCWP